MLYSKGGIQMVFGILFLLGVRCVYGLLAQRMAESRGYEKGFAWGFWLGLIGLIIIAFRRSDEIALPVSSAPETRWMCLECGTRNPPGVIQCQSCLTPRNAPRPKSSCPYCGAKNRAENEKCFSCGMSMKKTE